MKTQTKIGIAAIVIGFLGFGLLQVNRMNNNMERANATGERAIQVVEDTKEAVGTRASDMLDQVNTEELAHGLTEGLKEVGGDLKSRIREKIADQND